MVSRIEDIVLYHGSLEELNSRDYRKQYSLAKEETFLLSGTIAYYSNSDLNLSAIKEFYFKVRQDLCKQLFLGIVNMKTSFLNSPKLDSILHVIVEGTPITKRS